MTPPRILIVDDLFGRGVDSGVNEERRNLCGEYLIEDITGDEGEPSQRIRTPIAQAVFWRGQRPHRAAVGDTVENDLSGTLERIGTGWAEPPRWALVLLDLCFYSGLVTRASDSKTRGVPEGRAGDDDPTNYFGMVLLRAIRERFPDLPVAILSSKPRADVAQEFSRAGAVGFLARGEDDKIVLKEFLWRHGLIPDDIGAIVGTSVALLQALRSARRAGSTRRNVLLRGERGVGKELLAAYLHRSGAGRGSEPFVTVDSGALQASLYASELFGHVRGAFTGADRDRTGRLVDADGGDLFLDEIGNMPHDAQTGLLRVIETGEVIPVGGRSGRRVDVRVLSATNEDIEARALEKGGFRADLLDRLRQGGTISIPPLRDRIEDIPELALGFVREAEKATGARERTIDPEALAKLQALPWHGNIRELRSRLFEAVAANRDVELLALEHLGAPKPAGTAVGLEAATFYAASTDRPSATGSLEDVLRLMSSFDFASLRAVDLVGKLPKIEAAFAEMLARYLGAALRTQLRHTARAPEGTLLTHPALVLMTGAESLSATKAYDLIIGLRHLPGAPSSLWDGDPILREAYERAMARRRLKKKRGTESPGP